MNQNVGKYIIWLVIAAVLATGLVISSIVITNGFIEVKGARKSLTVTGSASKEIRSDFIVWTGSFSTQSQNLSDAYKKLKIHSQKVSEYLINKGISKDNIVFSSINTSTYYKTLSNGRRTNEIESYKLWQNVEIKSSDVDKITDISRTSTDLINEGVEFTSNPPRYFYTKLADLKIDMIELATKDCKTRAEKMLSVTGNSVGRLNSAKVGVFQITPVHSNEISDYGINDTSSLEKKITAVVTCEFEVK